jgi:quercetin dioxygenase-like cupin family protein
MTDTPKARSIRFFHADDAPSLEEDGMMSAPDIPKEVYTTLNLVPWLAGLKTKVLFKGDGDHELSLVYAHFLPGYRLPRHSHSADCLYYVLSGEAHMGASVIGAGDGFFIRADQPYAYEAGPDGVEVLEFRTSTSFDAKVFDRTVERWKPIVEAAEANHDTWLEMQS